MGLKTVVWRLQGVVKLSGLQNKGSTTLLESGVKSGIKQLETNMERRISLGNEDCIA